MAVEAVRLSRLENVRSVSATQISSVSLRGGSRFRSGSEWSGLCWLSLIWLIFASLPQVTEAQQTGRNPSQGIRLLFCGPERPVILLLNISAGRFSIDEMRSRYATEVFKLLDQDGDGVLSAEEAARIPVAGRLRAAAERLGDRWQELDQTPQDGKISLAELSDFLNIALGPTLSIERAPPKLAATVRLFDDLDTDRNGRISGEEIERGWEQLRNFDFDDDETLSVAELQPFPLSIVRAQQQATADEEPLPLLFLRNADEIESGVALLSMLYGAADAIPQQMLSGLSEREFERFDLNSDGRWDQDEQELFLKRAPVQWRLDISLAPPQVKVVQGEFQPGERPQLNLGGLPVEWRARSQLHQQLDNTRLYLTRFLIADADKNRYLDRVEFAGLQTNVPFEDVDLDGNGQVTREEIQFFFSLDGLAEQSRLVLSLSNETRTLFEILDSNQDRRLSPREFFEGRKRLAEFDLNGDGALSREELHTRFRVTVSHPELMETDPGRMMNMAGTQRQGIVSQETSGPLWFRRMDTNLDGEVSWREFLGPREVFDALDQNGDQVIDLAEAQASAATTAAGKLESEERP